MAVCIPIYNDWLSVMLRLSRIDTGMRARQVGADVMLIDDGFTEALTGGLVGAQIER